MMAAGTSLSDTMSSFEFEGHEDNIQDQSRALVLEANEILKLNSGALQMHNLGSCSDHIQAQNTDYPDQLSISSSPGSACSEIGKLQHSLDIHGNFASTAGDRVMSRRSTQQAPTDDLFARPPSSYRPGTGRLNSAGTNAGSTSDAFNTMGLGPEDYTNELHRNLHGAFETETSLDGKPQSNRIEESIHNMFRTSDLGDSQISDDIRDLFKYIDAYKVQQLELGTLLKPFIPEYILAVGAIDEFIKVPRPDKEPDHLGLKVLDESGAKQSDPAVLTLQLRAASKQPSLHLLEVASIENADKNPKKLDDWINSIKDLHRSKPPPCVIYSEAMPEVDKLMQLLSDELKLIVPNLPTLVKCTELQQSPLSKYCRRFLAEKEWPTEIEKVLAEIQLPAANLDVDLATFVDICCSILDIPVYKSRVESLHVMFSLYLELRNSSQQFSDTANEWTSRL